MDRMHTVACWPPADVTVDVVFCFGHRAGRIVWLWCCMCVCHCMIMCCSHLSVDFSAGLDSALLTRSMNRSQWCSMCGLACMHALHWWRLSMFTCRRALSSLSPMHVCGFVALQPENNTCQKHKKVSADSKLCKFFVEIHYRFVVCPSIAGGAHPPVQL